MGTKRVSIELPMDQYEFLRKEATTRGLTISRLLQQLIEARRGRRSGEIPELYQSDPLFRRRGSFDGPPNLAEEHDRYLYGASTR